ncbi:hypothetical protein PTKIN_Ptkin05aG0018000 [Pterospermum kingtungense]
MISFSFWFNAVPLCSGISSSSIRTRSFSTVQELAPLEDESSEDSAKDNVEHLLTHQDDVARLMKMERKSGIVVPGKRWFPYLDRFRCGTEYLRSSEKIWTFAVEFPNLDLPLLQTADVAAYSSATEISYMRLINLFQGLGNAQVLCVELETIECLMDFPALLEREPCPFSRLKTLIVKTDEEGITIPNPVLNFFGSDFKLRVRMMG